MLKAHFFVIYPIARFESCMDHKTKQEISSESSLSSEIFLFWFAELAHGEGWALRRNPAWKAALFFVTMQDGRRKPLLLFLCRNLTNF